MTSRTDDNGIKTVYQYASLGGREMHPEGRSQTGFGLVLAVRLDTMRRPLGRTVGLMLKQEELA